MRRIPEAVFHAPPISPFFGEVRRANLTSVGGEEARTNSLIRETNGFGACTLPLDRETMSLATRVAAREKNGTRGPRAIFISHGRAERLFHTKLLRSIPQKNAFDGKLTRATLTITPDR